MTPKYWLIFIEPYEIFILWSFFHLFKGAKIIDMFCLHTNECSIFYPQTIHRSLKKFYAVGVPLYYCSQDKKNTYVCGYPTISAKKYQSLTFQKILENLFKICYLSLGRTSCIYLCISQRLASSVPFNVIKIV